MTRLPVVFTSGQARSAGIGRSALGHRVRKGELIRLRTDTYCSREWWDRVAVSSRLRHVLELRAAWLTVQYEVWASHCSAALVHGLYIPHRARPPVTITALPGSGRRGRHGKLWIREAQLPPEHRTSDWGIGLVTPARAALDIAREHGFHAGLAAADSALHLGCGTPAELREVAEFMTGWPGGVAVAKVAAHASGLRESALESDSFATFVDHDVELPECNVWLDERTRTDVLWRRHRLAGEADGKIKYVQPWQPPETVLWAEKLRQERIEDLGFVVVRWTAAELRRSPEVVLDRIGRRSHYAHALYGVPLLHI